MRAASLFTGALVATCVSAARLTINVGANKTADPSLIFQPQTLVAKIGDVIVFNFTNGTYDVAQSTFAAPCTLAHETNETINGFHSGARAANNGTSMTTLEVPIVNNDTIWFFENSTCSQGGVGGININDSSLETLDGFTRNAERLYGPQPSSSARPSQTSSSSSSPSTTADSSSPAERNAVMFSLFALPLAALAAIL